MKAVLAMRSHASPTTTTPTIIAATMTLLVLVVMVMPSPCKGDSVWYEKEVRCQGSGCGGKNGVLRCRFYPVFNGTVYNITACLGIPYVKEPCERLEFCDMADHPFKRNRNCLYSCPAQPQLATTYTGGPGSADILFPDFVNPNGPRFLEQGSLCYNFFYRETNEYTKVLAHGGAAIIGTASSQDPRLEVGKLRTNAIVPSYLLGPFGNLCFKVINRAQERCNYALHSFYLVTDYVNRYLESWGLASNVIDTCSGQSYGAALCLFLLQYRKPNGKLYDVPFTSMILSSPGLNLLSVRRPTTISLGEKYSHGVKVAIACGCYGSNVPPPGTVEVPKSVPGCVKTCFNGTVLQAFSTAAVNLRLDLTVVLDGSSITETLPEFLYHASLPDHPDAKQVKQRWPERLDIIMDTMNLTSEGGLFTTLANLDTSVGPATGPLVGATATLAQFNRTVDINFRHLTSAWRSLYKCCLGYCPQPGQVAFDPQRCAAPLADPTTYNWYHETVTHTSGMGIIGSNALIASELLRRLPGVRVYYTWITFPLNPNAAAGGRAGGGHGASLIFELGTSMQYRPLNPYEHAVANVVLLTHERLIKNQVDPLAPLDSDDEGISGMLFRDMFIDYPMTAFDGSWASITELGASSVPGGDVIDVRAIANTLPEDEIPRYVVWQQLRDQAIAHGQFRWLWLYEYLAQHYESFLG